MAATAIDRATGLASSAAFKAPVYVATTANIALSGLLTIDGVALTAGKRVLVKDQSVPAQNGIYIAAASDWQRAPDLTSNDSVREGTRVFVTDGATQAGTEYVVTAADPISIGTTSMTWATSSSLLNAGAVGSAIHNATADTISDADEVGFYETVAGLLRKITWASLLTTIGAAFGAIVAAVAGKTTPVDADLIAIADSASANATKKVTLANLWANFIKAKADALYLALSGGGTVTGATPLMLQYDDNGAAIGPTLRLLRNSASPAASDVIGALLFQGKNSLGTLMNYTDLYTSIVDPTNGSEDAALFIETYVAGVSGARLVIGAGIYTTNSGGDKGADTVNALKYYIGSGVFWSAGAGTPEGVVTAPIGSLFSRTDGGATTTLYVKTSGAGNTGWTAK